MNSNQIIQVKVIAKLRFNGNDVGVDIVRLGEVFVTVPQVVVCHFLALHLTSFFLVTGAVRCSVVEVWWSIWARLMLGFYLVRCGQSTSQPKPILAFTKKTQPL